MNVYRLPLTVPVDDGLRRLSREADSLAPDGASGRGATNMRPVSRKGCWEVRLLPRSGDTIEDRCSVGLRGVMNDRVGVDAPSVFGVMFKSLPERDGVRERDGTWFDGFRLIDERFCSPGMAVTFGRLVLSGLLDTPASPALDRELDEGAACRFVDGVVSGERVPLVWFCGMVTSGNRLTAELRDGIALVSLRGVAITGDRGGVADDGFAEVAFSRFADGVFRGVRVPDAEFCGAETPGERPIDGFRENVDELPPPGVAVAGDRLGVAWEGAAEGRFCRLAEGVLIGARVIGAALCAGVMLGERLMVGAREGVAGVMLRGVAVGAAIGERLPEPKDREGASKAADERLGVLNPLEGDREIRGAGVAERLKLGEGADGRLIEGVKDRLKEGPDDLWLNEGPDECRPTDGADERPPDREAPSASICNPANNSRQAQGIRRL